MLAGVSVDYYARLERGKAGNVSDQVLTAIEDALQLDDYERQHLRALAGPRPSRPRRVRPVKTGARPRLRTLIEAMDPVPAILQGPVLLVGLGGVWIEAPRDVRLLPLDLSADDIADETPALAGAALLTGNRGAPPTDVAAVARIATAVADLASAHPQITELDLNPVIAAPDGATAADALIVIAGDGAPSPPA